MFRATDSVIRCRSAEIKKIFLCFDFSESDCLQKSFNNASQMSLFDVILKTESLVEYKKKYI